MPLVKNFILKLVLANLARCQLGSTTLGIALVVKKSQFSEWIRLGQPKDLEQIDLAKDRNIKTARTSALWNRFEPSNCLNLSTWYIFWRHLSFFVNSISISLRYCRKSLGWIGLWKLSSCIYDRKPVWNLLINFTLSFYHLL